MTPPYTGRAAGRGVRPRTAVTVVALLTLFFLPFGASLSAAAGAERTLGAGRTLDDAVYTREQARSGKKLYERYCQGCHERGYLRQVLRSRGGETLEPLFETLVALMPQNAPGSLTDDEYVDVIAYIVSQARFGHGSDALTPKELGSIVIPGPE